MLARMEPAAPQSVASAKARLRARVRSAWLDLDRDAVSAAVTARALELPELTGARCVAAYVGLATEVDTRALLAHLHRRGVKVLLPVVTADDALDWRVDDPGSTHRRGSRGTMEPPATAPPARISDADVVVVPGLAFDEDGRRLGRGGGSFDRALAELPEQVLRIALAPDEAVVERVPTEGHDVGVHVVITPTRLVTAQR